MEQPVSEYFSIERAAQQRANTSSQNRLNRNLKTVSPSQEERLSGYRRKANKLGECGVGDGGIDSYLKENVLVEQKSGPTTPEPNQYLIQKFHTQIKPDNYFLRVKTRLLGSVHCCNPI